MSLAYSRFKVWVAGWREWEPNPVLLKELRQAVRSGTLLTALLLLLTLLFGATVAILTRELPLASRTHQLGFPICRALLVVLSLATLLFLPLFVGIRLAAERRTSGLDLMFITTLAPRRIVRGKLLCGACLAALFFSVSAPFMTFANLLRGVDLPTIFFVLLCLFGVVCLALQAAILFACLPLHEGVKVFVGILFTLGLAAMTVGLVAFFSGLLQSGVGTMMDTWSFWGGFVALLILVVGTAAVLQRMAVVLIIADNRPRGYYNEVIRPAPHYATP